MYVTKVRKNGRTGKKEDKIMKGKKKGQKKSKIEVWGQT